MQHTLQKSLTAEFLGTFVLVLGGCGTAVLASGIQPGGVGLLGVSLAFGLTVVVMAYAVGHISGGHFNPAVTIGVVVGGRFPARDAAPYIVVQVAGAIVAAGVLLIMANGVAGFSASASGFASNGYDVHSPGGYNLASGLVTEIVLTAVFLIVIMGATRKSAAVGFAPLAIGLALTLIHLASIPITNTSVNPARSTGPAIFQGDWALEQLWMFWLAPIVGAIIGGTIYRFLLDMPEDEVQLGPNVVEERNVEA